MAEANNETAFRSLDCSICHDMFERPKTLPCQHSFCHNCLKSYIKSRAQKLLMGDRLVEFPCPLCQMVVQRSDDLLAIEKWADEFPTNYSLIGVIDDIRAKLNRKRNRPMCNLHCTKRVKYFCRVCNLLLCSSCTASGHKNCGVMPNISEAAEEMSHTKSQLFQQLQTKKTELQVVYSNLKTQRASLTINKEQLVREMKNEVEFIAKLFHELRQREKDALSELEDIYRAHQFTLTEALTECESTIISISSCQSLIDENELENISEAAFLQRVSDAKRKYNKLPDTAPTIPNPQLIKFQSDSCLQQQLQHLVKQPLGKIFLHLDSEGQESDGNSSVAHTETESTLTEMLDNDTGSSVFLNNFSTILIESNSLITDVTVLPDGFLAVTDSMRRQVKIFTDRGELVKQLLLENAPWGICRLIEGQIAVTVPSKRNIIYMSYTDKLFVQGTVTTVKKYLGIVTLDEKMLVCASASDSCVDILSIDGGIIQSFRQICVHPTYVALTKEHRIIVSDSYEKSLICCDRQGNVLFRYIGSEGQGLTQPAGICANRRGSIFVADAKSHNIYKINYLPLLRTIKKFSFAGLDISSENKLVLTHNDEGNVGGISLFCD